MRRSAWIGALAFAAWALPAPAQTAPDIDACLAAHEHGQIARKHDKLVDARRSFTSCAVDACPKLARDDCTTWLGEVDALVPTIELVVKDSNGAALPSARCTLDGAAIDVPLEAVALDPGVHALHCEADTFVPFDRALDIASGQKGRRIEVVLEAPKPPPPTPPAPTSTSTPTPTPTATSTRTPSPPPSPAPIFIAGGVALAAFATFAYLGETGVSTEDNLRATCKPDCSGSAVGAVRTRYNVADVFLGVGLVATGVTAWLYFSRRASSSDARVGVQALPGGGGARVAVPF